MATMITREELAIRTTDRLDVLLFSRFRSLLWQPRAVVRPREPPRGKWPVVTCLSPQRGFFRSRAPRSRAPDPLASHRVIATPSG
jgi:hypothetical protein